MLIILEGCDGAGKTTLAELLKNTIEDAQIIHCNRDTPNDMEFFKSIILCSHRQTIIADRFCYGQFVYQEREDRPLSYEDGVNTWDNPYGGLHRLETYILSQNVDVRLIYVYAEPDVIQKRLAMRNETVPIFNIMNRYEELWTKSLLQPIYYKT